MEKASTALALARRKVSSQTIVLVADASFRRSTSGREWQASRFASESNNGKEIKVLYVLLARLESDVSASVAPVPRSTMPYAPSRLRASPANATSPTSTPSPTRSTQSLPTGFGSAKKPPMPLPGSGLAMGAWGMGMVGDLAVAVERSFAVSMNHHADSTAEPADPSAAAGSDSSDAGADDY